MITPPDSHSKPALRILFVDFWERYNKNNNEITAILGKHYELIFDESMPEVVFYSSFGMEHLRYNNTLRFFVSVENMMPDFNVCDYAMSTCRMTLAGDNGLERYFYRNLALEFWARNRDFVVAPLNNAMAHRKFCSFLYSQDYMGKGAILRKEFCQKLMEYKSVDCPGKILHNQDVPELSERNSNNWHESKLNYLSQYKFNIAFENSSNPGYITEKLTDAFMCNTVPIYWGSNGDIAPFPREAVIMATDFDTLDDLVARIREIDENGELYMSFLKANPLHQGMENHFIRDMEAFLLPRVKQPPYDKTAGYRFTPAKRLLQTQENLQKSNKRIRALRNILKTALSPSWIRFLKTMRCLTLSRKRRKEMRETYRKLTKFIEEAKHR